MYDGKINIGSFTYERDENNQWIGKSTNITPFKKNGNLKAVYKDLPRFKIIVDYENQEVNDFNALLEQSVTEIAHKLLSFSSSINHL